MIGLDVKRREDQRYDIFCCVRRYSDFSSLSSLRSISHSPMIDKKMYRNKPFIRVRTSELENGCVK